MKYIDTQNLNKYSIKAHDGEIGSISDFYFDEDLFYLRYFVVDTKPFMLRNMVLVSPMKFRNFDSTNKIIEVSLTKDELEKLPPLDTVEVISRQYERAYNDHLLLPYYWNYGASAWAVGPYGIPWKGYKESAPELRNLEEKKKVIKRAQENSLRSSKEVCSYSVSGTDTEFGHIQGFILDKESLSIEFIIIDTINYLPSKNVILRPEWIEQISWASKTVRFPFTKEAIKAAPAYRKGELSEKTIKMSDEHFLKIINKSTVKNKNLKLIKLKKRKEEVTKTTEKETVVGHIPSGLFVVTVEDDKTDKTEGFLASWVQQVSFDPLLVSVCIKDGRPGIEKVLKKSPFCINVVGKGNTDYLEPFINQREKGGSPLNKIPHTKVVGKGAIIREAKSAMICKAYEISHPGDHYLITAEVIDGVILNDKLKSKTYLRDSGSHY